MGVMNRPPYVMMPQTVPCTLSNAAASSRGQRKSPLRSGLLPGMPVLPLRPGETHSPLQVGAAESGWPRPADRPARSTARRSPPAHSQHRAPLADQGIHPCKGLPRYAALGGFCGLCGASDTMHHEPRTPPEKHRGVCYASHSAISVGRMPPIHGLNP